jgi:5'-deoxynucleotidase YfbR-like HD superfamily hydrolase
MVTPKQEAPRAWQRMLSGRRLDLLDPSPLDIELEDIAHGLARVARWNGQTIGPAIFSVAQHSLLVEAIFSEGEKATREEQLAALLHDAPEYVVGDMISPFKAVIGSDYKAIERRLLSAIYVRFGLKASVPEALRKRIKQADQIAAYLEATQLAGFDEDEAKYLFGKPPVIKPIYALLVKPWKAEEAKTRFIERFLMLEAD